VRGEFGIAMISATRVFFGIAFLLCLASSSRSVDQRSDRKVEPNGPTAGAVAFEIAPVEAKAVVRQWTATYSAAGKTARFRIEMGPVKVSGDKAFPISSGKGRFLSEPGSDSSVLLLDLKKALGAKTVPDKIGKVASLPFEFVILGENQSRSSGGGFSDKQRGDWTAMKVFLAGGEGEVFLNLNPVANKAEFSIKDSDYGDIVLSELARIL